MRNLLLRFQAKVLLAVLLLISLFSNAQNQPWQEKMADPSVNIYEVKQSFDQAWLNRPVTKGKGYKQYKRWEYFMEARCFPTGVRFAPDAVYVAMEQQPEMFAFNSEMPGSWTYIGNTSVPTGGGGAGRVNGIRPMPGSTTTFFACAPAGGLWKTTNSGASWSLMNTDGLASIGVSDVAIDPNNTNIMYIATGDGDAGDTYALGVLKTTDGGLTWNSTGLNWAVTNNRTTSRLLIDPSDSQKVIAATSNGIYRTTNGGTSWTQVQTGSFKDLKFHPSNPLIVYATGGSYYRSADGGITWSNITSGLPTSDVTRMALAVSADNASYVYILAGKSSDAGMRGVYRSTDAGLTFTAQYTGPLNLMGWDPSGTDAGGQAWYDLVIEADPNDADVIYTGGVNVWKSSNGGTSWSIAGHWYGGGAPYVHADIHAMSFVPGTTRLLVGCDGGVFTTTDGGPNFSDISSNLQISQQYRLSVSQTNANLVLSGWQDNGTNLKNGATWTRPIGGDGMECIINPTNSSIMYGEIYYGDIRKSTNGGVSFPTQVCSSGGTGVNEDGAWVTPYVLGSNPAHLYVGKTRVYKSTDNGATFTTLGAIPGSTINSLCVAPADNNYIYASKGGTLYRSTNNGTSFTAVSGLPGSYISYICTNTSNAQEVYVTLSGFTTGVKVYKSSDAGATWTNISGSLPNIPANCIVYQTGSADNALYVGTDAGVYYRDDVLGNWVPYMNGMPNVVVDELEIQYGTNTIVAATFGRGTWSAPLYALPQRDVTFVSIDSPVGTTCESLIAPSFTILNAGEDDVTSVTISYQVDANPVLTYTWTGTLATGGSVVITPPTYDYGNGAFTLTASVTNVNGLGVDENTTNNSQTSSYFVSGGANSVTLNLLTDCYPEETSWSVTQGGTVIFQGAGYAGATNNSITMCLDDGCFVLNVYDSYGDGLSSCASGDYELTNDANGAVLATMATANFGTLATHSFCLNVPTPGCTDSGACNYNSAATTDDGSCLFGPTNDICANATNFTVNGGAVTVINTTTCFDGPNPTCGGALAIKDLWYKFTFTGGDITIQTSVGSSSGVTALTDTRIALFSSCGGTQIACNDDISGTNFYSRIIVTCAQLAVGQTYYVQVGGYNATIGVCSLNITRTDISGCTNPLASNYNVCATIDNGTCIGLSVPGCMNASACNYNALATTDDGSCVLPTTYYRDLDNDTYGNAAQTIQACSLPVGYVTNSTDCNDSNAAIHPGATEVCNTVDDDCDGSIDEGVQSTFYRDLDNDTYGNAAQTIQACSAPVGYVSNSTDCNDSNSAIHPGATEVCNTVDDDCDGSIDEGVQSTFYRDLDNDTYGNAAQTIQACSAPVGYVSNSTDCNDSNSAIHPGATEVCNTIDEDCDGTVDEGVLSTFYRDLDNDTYGNATQTIQACSAPVGYVSNSTDCNDSNSAIHPGATEICNTIDEDCDGTVDEGVLSTFYRDLDNDTYGDVAQTIQACTAPIGYVSNPSDCDDNNAAINPGTTELCNTIDDDCDGTVDDNVAFTTYYEDADGDGFGNPSVSTSSCSSVVGYVTNDQDCDDLNDTIYLGANELCDGLDQDCDGTADDNIVFLTYYADADGDGFGNPSVSTSSCSTVLGYVTNDQDCDDLDDTIYPGSIELCDGIDQDCDGTEDDNITFVTYYADADNDGYGNPSVSTSSCSAVVGYVTNDQDCDDLDDTIHPGAFELCDGIDQDCDGLVDDGAESTFYLDFDNDSYGDVTQTIQACTAPVGYVSNPADCDDTNASVHPGIAEICDGLDQDCDGTVDDNITFITYYADADSDGYGDIGNSVISCSSIVGFVTNNEDCDDGNDAIHPGATELCNGINDDCDGLLDEGCGTSYASNDNPGAAQTVAVGTLYNCNSSVSGDLSNASPSGESLIACVTGEDLWYSFTALTPGVRIQVISGQNNIVIELQDTNGNLIDSENINGSLGNEILNFGGLTPGNQYLVAIRNFNSSQGIGTFSLCISKLNQTTCDYPGPNFSLCDWYKADYTGAHAYVFHFTPLDGGDEITVTKYGSTVLPLSNVPGLQYEHDYQVTIDAVYQLTNGLMQPEFVTVQSTSVCDMNVGSPNLPGLRSSDQCPNLKTLYSYIQLTPGVCGASLYAWEVTRVDIPQLPVVVNSINSKFLQVKSSNGFVPGGVYNVRVSAVFGNNPPMHYGPVQCVQIVGSAGLTLEQEELSIEEPENQNSEFVIFPNPTVSELNILPFVALSETVRIELLDQMGKIVYSEKIYNLDGSIIKVELPLEISSGLYLLHIENGDLSYQKKIVIEK